jgi:eukaryotic-like serine/threonine-protein kinase
MRALSLLPVTAAMISLSLWLAGCAPESAQPPAQEQVSGVAGPRADPAGTGFYQTSPLRQLSGSNGGLLWKARTGFVTKGVPVVIHDAIYATGSSMHSLSPNIWEQLGSSRDDLYALDAMTGKTRWSFPGDGSGLLSPAYADGIVVFTSGKDNLYAVSSSSGKEVWRFSMKGVDFGQPTATSETVYFQTGTENTYDLTVILHALDLKSGKEKWTLQVPGMPTGSGQPLVVDGVVYFSTGWFATPENEVHDSTLYAIDAATGQQKWKYTPPKIPRVGDAGIASLTAGGGFVYFADHQTSVYALNAETGAGVWQFNTEEINPTIALADGAIYVTTYRATFALDAKTGEQKWKTSHVEGTTTTPAVAGDMLYFGNDLTVHALNTASGEEVWRYDVTDPGNYLSNIAVMDGTIYFIGSNESVLYALR